METVIDRDTVVEITSHFKALTSVIPLHPIRNEGEYDKAVATLNQLLDLGASNELHPLVDLVSTLGSLIGDYDDAHYPAEKVAPVEALRFLMNQHELGQSDLPEVGTQGVVSEVLRGKRELNVRQIKALSERFRVPVSVFI
jgi:HTH-type transcriptional regulator/antitoxin HigA